MYMGEVPMDVKPLLRTTKYMQSAKICGYFWGEYAQILHRNFQITNLVSQATLLWFLLAQKYMDTPGNSIQTLHTDLVSIFSET